jgi:hypothetical protein
VRQRTIVLGLALAVLVVTPAIALGGSAGARANSQTFNDSIGEDATAPDITTTAVSNDDQGNIVFRINVPNRPALTPDMLFLIFIDTIPNAGDPDSLGADWAIQLESGGVALFQWNGSDYLFAQSQSSLASVYAATGPTIRINALDLGKAKVMNFVVLAFSGIAIDAAGNPSFANARDDIAPDAGRGTYAYQVLTTFSLRVVGFTTGPRPAKAGTTFSAGLAATQSDTAGLVAQGTVTCNARIAGRRVPVRTSRVRNGVAGCVWSIPGNAGGRTIQGTITLTVQGTQVKRSFSQRISR